MCQYFSQLFWTSMNSIIIKSFGQHINYTPLAMKLLGGFSSFGDQEVGIILPENFLEKIPSFSQFDASSSSSLPIIFQNVPILFLHLILMSPCFSHFVKEFFDMTSFQKELFYDILIHSLKYQYSLEFLSEQ